ncbi:MAG: gamma-glutamyl-gamma-aminobutyrate hydrolase family protein [Candidatus Brocadiia bacterium]
MPKVLVNFDYFEDSESWYRSVYRCPKMYVDLLVDNGVVPISALPFPKDKVIRDTLVNLVDGFLFIGGGDYPSSMFNYPSLSAEQPMSERRAANDLALFQSAWLTSKPMLGICAGMQLATLAFGGKLIPDLPDEHAFHKAVSRGEDSMHPVTIAPGRLRSILGVSEASVNSAHHQAVDGATLSENYFIAATASDGTIEAMERRRKGFGLFLQWHPERHPVPEHRKKIFSTFSTAVLRCFDERQDQARGIKR